MKLEKTTPTPSQLVERVRNTGAKDGLFTAVSGRLWDVKDACEKGNRDRMKDFRAQMARARKSLDEAEELFYAWEAMRDSPTDQPSAGPLEKGHE